ncbi:MAG: penicillin-binding protein activator [Thiomicrospira sp.]|uniref:penicillin-binding protein activator n=1 Tax=Thiomicrospira sp. TaxID=935 RepID=UPI0019DB51BE|nr:penicillin-binding protein activator [Thiomicrospira sp.]MBE0493109.1 penicillin-binding protein activator [Thiomicrospira sp.]
MLKNNLLKYILLISLVLGLISCTVPPKPIPAERGVVPFEAPILQLDSRLERLQQARIETAKKADWVSYIQYTEALWEQSTDDQRALILQDTWITLQAVELEAQQALIENGASRVSAWGWLLSSRQQQGLNFKRALEDLQQVIPDASFSQNLIPELLAHFEELRTKPRTIAVMLPFSDRLSAVSEQIRAGILKAYWQSNQNDKLIFFNTKDPTEILHQYNNAKQAGADIIIGPLTPEAIQTLMDNDATDLIALNDIDQAAPFVQFSYRNQYEAQQLIYHLELEHYRHIAVLTSDNETDTKLTHQLQSMWSKSHAFPLTVQSYPQRNPNLRAEMSKVLNADASQSRAGHLSRSINQPIEFFPRTRQDFEAMILMGDEKQIAILQPQLDYYLIDLPIYGSSMLTPDSLSHARPNRDLKNIRFPSFPAALETSPLQNGLEAFGWDSFLIATQKHLLAPGLMVHGAMGQHSITQTNKVFTKLTWSRFLPNGRLVPLYPDKFSPPYFGQLDRGLETSLSKEEMDKIRQDLLDEITQPRFEELPVRPSFTF